MRSLEGVEGFEGFEEFEGVEGFEGVGGQHCLKSMGKGMYRRRAWNSGVS